MTDMDKMMIEPCPFCGWEADGALRTDAGLTLRHDGKGCALTGLWFKLDLWNARIPAYNPDDRLKEALELFVGQAVFEPETHRASVDEFVVSKARAALSPLPQGDG